jgi:hypothetical protein
MGQCLACNGIGLPQTLCATCADSGLVDEPVEDSDELSKIKSDDETCLARNGSGALGQPCVT